MASSCTSPNAPRERLSPRSSCRLTTFVVRPSIFFCASSIVASRAITLAKVSLVRLKPSSRRSPTLPLISPRRESTDRNSASICVTSCSVRLRTMDCAESLCALPCAESVSCSCVSVSVRMPSSRPCTAADISDRRWAIDSRFAERSRPCASWRICIDSRVCCSSCETLARTRSACVAWLSANRSAEPASAWFRSTSIARCFSSSSAARSVGARASVRCSCPSFSASQTKATSANSARSASRTSIIIAGIAGDMSWSV